MQCVILAGGLGTRMRPLTYRIPKLLIPVDGVPFAEYQLRWLATNGITQIIYCVGYKGNLIKEYVRDGSDWGLSVAYVDDGPGAKGTGGAIRMAFESGQLAEAFFVLYGDSFLPIALRPVHQAFHESGLTALMTVYRNLGRWDSSNVIFEDGIVQLYDKNPSPPVAAQMSYIDYGLSVLTRHLVQEELSESLADLASLYNRLSIKGCLAGYEVHERFYEIGSPGGLADFQCYAQNSRLLSRLTAASRQHNDECK